MHRCNLGILSYFSFRVALSPAEPRFNFDDPDSQDQAYYSH